MGVAEMGPISQVITMGIAEMCTLSQVITMGVAQMGPLSQVTRTAVTTCRAATRNRAMASTDHSGQAPRDLQHLHRTAAFVPMTGISV
ncbi:hypothetical protein ACOMHN_036687 [Nucella lapillus]